MKIKAEQLVADFMQINCLRCLFSDNNSRQPTSQYRTIFASHHSLSGIPQSSQSTDNLITP